MLATADGLVDRMERLEEEAAHADPERTTYNRQLGERITAALDKLTPRERVVFELRRFQGLRLRGIGDVLGTSEEAAKNCLFRATQKMRNVFGGSGMTCGQVKDAIPFYYYGELPPEQEEELEAHSASCAPCNREVENYRKFASSLDEAELEPSLGLLSECRELLAQRVTEWERPAPKANWWEKYWQEKWKMDFRVPVAALALLTIGWFSAKIYAPQPSNAAIISTVRSVEPDASGHLTIAVDDVQRRIVSGRLNDDNVRRLLLTAARDESNPGVQVECVDALKKMAYSSDIRATLLVAVQHDPSPSVRMEVIALLVHDGSMVGVMQNQVRREDNSHVRVRLQKALQQMNASEGVF